MKHKILFVCLGNICRSPAAEAIMRSLSVKEGRIGIEIDSAGTYAGHTGELPDPRMRRAAAARGIEMTHRARQIREEDFELFDRIVVMDDSNYERVSRLAPSRIGQGVPVRRILHASSAVVVCPRSVLRGQGGIRTRARHSRRRLPRSAGGARHPRIGRMPDIFRRIK